MIISKMFEYQITTTAQYFGELLLIPDNTPLNKVIQKNVKTIPQANKLVTFHRDKPFTRRIRLNFSCIHQSLSLDGSTLIGYLALYGLLLCTYFSFDTIMN